MANETLYGGPNDLGRAQTLWSLLEARGLVGPDGLRTPLIPAQEPAGQLIEVLSGQIIMDGVSTPAFVKRVYADVPHAVIDTDPMAQLVHLVVMVRAETGYNPQADDWFFVRYGPNGAVLHDAAGVPEAGRLHAGSDIGCMACHRTAPGDDFLFTTDRTF